MIPNSSAYRLWGQANKAFARIRRERTKPMEMKTEKKTPKIQKKLSLNRETLRTVSAEQLEEIAGGATTSVTFGPDTQGG
jgi:hypothetical protein